MYIRLGRRTQYEYREIAFAGGEELNCTKTLKSLKWIGSEGWFLVSQLEHSPDIVVDGESFHEWVGLFVREK